VGADGQGRALQETHRAGGVNEIAPDLRRDVKVGRANSTRISRCNANETTDS
jgi:hypothetical protein